MEGTKEYWDDLNARRLVEELDNKLQILRTLDWKPKCIYLQYYDYIAMARSGYLVMVMEGRCLSTLLYKDLPVYRGKESGIVV